MKRLELTVPTSLLDDLEILSDRFFRHNRSVQVLQSFSLRPQTNALIVRVQRKGPFKDEATVRREARAIARRYRVARFEVLSGSGHNVAVERPNELVSAVRSLEHAAQPVAA